MLRNKLRYLLLLASVGLLSVLYNQYYIGMVFLTIVAMPFLLFALLCYIFGSIKAELVSVVHVANKGEVVPISIQMNNPTIFPISNLKIYINYKNAYSPQKYKKEFSVSIDGRTKTSVICNMFSEYAGNFEISLKGIRIYDYLKLFSLKKKLRGELKVAILPYFYELPENDISSRNARMVESDYYSSVKSGDDPSEVFTIREYREGDRLQRIHWKLSRKQDQLMIKEFSDPLNCSVLLFINLSIPKGENVLSYMDAILECALSISFSFLAKGQMHYLSWYDLGHGACTRIRVSKEKELFEALDGLLQARPYTETTDELSAYLAEHPNDQYTDLFYVTGEVSESRLDSLSMIKALTRQMVYLSDIANLSSSHYMPVEVIQRSGEMGIDLWSVDVGNVRRDIEQLRLS
ncbi:MAG: DUF58 domain-containing protein [Mobilitalea sp.]